jgi:hypothetical protein
MFVYEKKVSVCCVYPYRDLVFHFSRFLSPPMVIFAFAFPYNFCSLLNLVASSKYGNGPGVMKNVIPGPFVFPTLFGFLIVISV